MSMGLLFAASSAGVIYAVVGTLVAACIAAFAAIYGPARLARQMEEQQMAREEAADKKRAEREEQDRQLDRDRRLEDIDRQDQVTRQVQEAAEKAEEARVALAQDNAETAKEALRQQEAVARQAQEAARLLAESNERVAAHAAAASEMTNAKLKEIKILVDGSYTAAMRGELNALRAHQATLKELIADRKGAGREPGKDTVRTLKDLEAEIAVLEVNLAERLEAVAKAEIAGQTGLS